MERISYIAFYLLHFAFCEASLVKTPINKAVILGQRMEMECRTDNETLFRKWDFLQVGNKSPRAIATNDKANIEIHVPPTISGYGVNVDHEGSATLYSNTTETTFAGVYICQRESLSGSAEFKYSAQLIVFESEPICDTNLTTDTLLVDGDYVWNQCRVNFKGNWAPTMEWRQHSSNVDSDEGRLILDETVTHVTENSSITSILTVLVDSTNYGSYYSCRTYFTWHNGKLKTNASNVPDFTHTWSTKWNRSLRPETYGVPSSTGIIKDTTTQNTIKNADITTILLITGTCLLVCILLVATVGVVYCVLHTRKLAAAKESKESAEVLASEYDLIPYACADGYDTIIEEVDVKDDIPFTKFPPRHGPLPSPEYSGLTADELKPPGVYTRMDLKEKSIEDEKNDADEMKLQSDLDHDHPTPSDVEETAMKRTMRADSSLYLTAQIVGPQDIASMDEDIGLPSAYLKITDDSKLQ